MRTGVDVKVGDEVFVKPASYSYRKGSSDLVPARVTAVARVWLVAEETEHASSLKRAWRLRRDVQNEGRDSVYQARFFTPEQAEQRMRLDAANATLKTHGINIVFGSAWDSPERRIALAASVEILAAELGEVAEQ